jgi:lambda family phage portal protein
MAVAKRKSLRGRAALALAVLGTSINRGFAGAAMSVAGLATNRGGYQAGKRSSRRTRNWGPGEGSPATDILPDLGALRGRSRDLERNHPLVAGAMATKTNGVVGQGLTLRSVIDGDVLGITDPVELSRLQYQIEREWEIFEAECDWTGQQHFRDLQRLIYRSARVSGDIGIVRRYRKRPGETYGTRLVLIEADRISNPNRATDTPTVQGGVQISTDGEELGYHISDKHPGDLHGLSLNWSYVPRRGTSSGLVQFLLARQITRPGQVRGVPLFAPIIEQLKQLSDYTDAEIKAAVNDAYLFAFEKTGLGEDGEPVLTNPEGRHDESGELTLEDLTVTTLPYGSDIEVKKPERPNAAFGDFVRSFCEYIGVALSLPYEVLLMHFNSSFSASRGALEVAWKADQVDQAWLIRSVVDQVRLWQFTEMVASGRFDAPGFFDDPIKRNAWLGRVWVGPTRIQINPQVEANADKTDVEMGSKTLEQVMTERTGGDFDTKSKQILRERATLGPPQAPGAAAPNDERNNDGTDRSQS